MFLVPRLCGGAGECENEYMCKDSMCLPQCNADEECAQNERCSRGACLCKYLIRWNVFQFLGSKLIHYLVIFHFSDMPC